MDVVDGKREQHVNRLVSNNGYDGKPACGPDGHSLIYASGRDSYNVDLFLRNTDSVTAAENLTTSDGYDSDAVWSEDGHHIYFTSTRYWGNYGIWRLLVDEREETQLSNRADEPYPGRSFTLGGS